MNTPTPWFIHVDDDHWSDKDDVELWGNPTGAIGGARNLCNFWSTHANAEANAKFALRAVNSHQALIDALENCMSQIQSHDPAGCNPSSPYDRLSQARAALKLAKGA